MSKLVSIIVPIYNVERYLYECLKSIKNQTYTNIEILLINDGSTDNCANICDKFSEQDSRIKVFHKVNQGVSETRNFGMTKANGEYIVFIDADDIIDETLVETLIEGISECDIAICGYKELYKNANINHNIGDTKKITNVEGIDKIFDRSYYGGYLWNKIFKTSIIRENDINFRKNIGMLEDMLFVVEYMTKIKTVKLINQNLYYYRMRQSSAVWKNDSKKIGDMNNSYYRINEILKLNNIYSINFNYCIALYYLRNKKFLEKMDKKIDYKEKVILVYKSKEIDIKKKIKLIISGKFYFVYNIYMKNKTQKYILFE